jgi:2-polyprenyl-6-methoxyphenol hydroxylase-like FAD-dependent oxidoreductase
MVGNFHVVVVGGGIGGLCLAQGLKKSGISVDVYERDESAVFRAQGYRISLKDTGAGALHDCLPENLFELCVATSIRTATRMVVMDEHLNQKFAMPLPQGAPGIAGFGVNRLTLREILLAGLDGAVHFGKTYERFEQAEDGRVTACFADGTSAAADLLVGADGTWSRVRQQLVPDAVIDDLGWTIYGKSPIGPDTMEWLPESLTDSFNRISGPGGVGISVATCRTCGPVADAAAKFAPGLSLTEIPGYLSWTLSGADDRYRNAEGQTLRDLTAELVREWHPAVRRLVADADAAATFPVTLTSAQPVPRWHASNVTLLGDAIHTMSPGRGDGANTALADARLLRQALAGGAASEAPVADAKDQYEREMLRYGFEAVAKSRNEPFLRRAKAVPRNTA